MTSLKRSAVENRYDERGVEWSEHWGKWANDFIKELIRDVVDAPIPEDYDSKEVDAWIAGSNDMRERVLKFMKGETET